MLFRSNDTATTEIYTWYDTLSLHDALPIYEPTRYRGQVSGRDTSFVQAVYPLFLTDSEVPFTARARYPRGLGVLYSLARKSVE